MRRSVILLAVLLAGCGGSSGLSPGAGTAGRADGGSAGEVPVPEIEGPITGGSHGWPWWETPLDLGAFGYVEEEFFLSGTASNRGLVCAFAIPEGLPNFGGAQFPGGGGCELGGEVRTAPYKVRILVRRPVDPARFNGTAVLEWANVSLQMEIEHDWPLDYPMLMREGFVSAMVSAQQIGVQGFGPFALKTWDPQRYGSLDHPGDEFSYDIYAQAARAIREGLVVNGLPVATLLGTGTSQSCLYLNTYIPLLQPQDGLFDGFHPTLCPASAEIPDDLVPIIFATSESEAQAPGRPDGPLLRSWEIPGSHINYYEASMAQAQVTRATGLLVTPYDEDDAGQYGERGPVLLSGVLPVNILFGNTFPTRYSFRAALHHLNRWVRRWKACAPACPAELSAAPPVAPRFENRGLGRDMNGNVAGGVPQPALEVPVANYVTVTFGGFTAPFDPVRLLLMYPTHEDYVSKMQAATDKAVAAGYMLPEDAGEWMARVAASPVP